MKYGKTNNDLLSLWLSVVNFVKLVSDWLCCVILLCNYVYIRCFGAVLLFAQLIGCFLP